MKYFSLFSGVGGFELGIEYAHSEYAKRVQQGIGDKDLSGLGEPLMGTESLCVGFSEIDKHASAVLRYHYPDIKNYGDISQIDWSTVPDFDLLVGGSPCQDFSIAGKRAGLAGARSGLFGEYVRALEEKKPAYFIWENVKGVLSSNDGRDFAIILNALAESGYALWWQVLNAKDFGVPQNRERIFIVGSRNGSPREVFFERESSGDHQDGGVIAGTVTSRYPASQREGAYIEETRHSRGAIEQLNQPKHSNNRLYGTGGGLSSLEHGAGRE